MDGKSWYNQGGNHLRMNAMAARLLPLIRPVVGTRFQQVETTHTEGEAS